MRAGWHTLANLFRGSDRKIGVRLNTCFLTIVVLMIVGDAVSIWQLRQLEAHTQMLKTADMASSAIVRLHLDVNSFSGRVAVLTRGHDARQFAKEAAVLRETFQRHVREAEQILNSSSGIAQDAFTSSTLEVLKATLPTQIESEIELANAGDWPAIQLRLTGQIQDLIDLSSSLVEGVEERTFQQRARVNEQTEQVRHHLFIVVPAAWMLTLLVAAVLGWYVTRTITVPLSELTLGAEALARRDFRHQVNVAGNDELAVLGKAFNHAARQLNNQFETTLEVRVAERTRIARNLHDTLLQSFHGLLYRFQAARFMFPERMEEGIQSLDAALIRTEQALEESRNSIQGLRLGLPAESELDQMLIATSDELASHTGEGGSPQFRVFVEGERQSLYPIIKEEIGQIARELIRNAFRHARAHKIEAELRYEADFFRLLVRDDGKGIAPEILRDGGCVGHWGLPGVYERAHGIGAQLEFGSEAGAGTEVRLTIPAPLAYEGRGVVLD
ncbi:MAG: ATP-binding protein [Candidatus Sulfotelmatobacter sp.]